MVVFLNNVQPNTNKMVALPPPQAKPSHCEQATEEINLVAQKLITSSEGDLQLSYAKQRRTKSSALLHKELDARSNRAVRQYLVKVLLLLLLLLCFIDLFHITSRLFYIGTYTHKYSTFLYYIQNSSY